MRERLRAGQTAVDVGAFKGAYTFWMQRSVGPGGVVIAFEPQPRQVEYLRDVLDAMDFRNVTLEAMGVSDAPDILPFYLPRPGRGSAHDASFVAKGDPNSVDPIDVPVTTLDTYFADRPDKPDFLKIDVEGHELAVLEGAREILTTSRPTLLLECETRHRPDGDVQPVLSFLASLGYMGSFFQSGRRMPVAQFDVVRHQQHEPGERLPKTYVNNFAFEHPSRIAADS